MNVRASFRQRTCSRPGSARSPVVVGFRTALSTSRSVTPRALIRASAWWVNSTSWTPSTDALMTLPCLGPRPRDHDAPLVDERLEVFLGHRLAMEADRGMDHWPARPQLHEWCGGRPRPYGPTPAPSASYTTIPFSTTSFRNQSFHESRFARF